MTRSAAGMHVARTPSSYVDKAGGRRRYESVLVRRSYREGGKVKHQTLANLSKLPAQVVEVVEQALRGERLVPAGEAFTIRRSLPHGHVAAVAAMARRLGLPGLLGPPCRQRDLAYALILSRVVHPGSKLATLSWWADTTLGEDLGIADASTDEVYAAMDWLAERQDRIEATLATKHLAGEANPHTMALFDLSSSWVEGRHCPLAARGYSRDGKKGKEQIEYGLLTDPDGRPVAVRVFPGNTADPAAFTDIVHVVRDTFGLEQMVMVGDRGMITSARIAALDELDGDIGWVTALRAPQIAALARDDGPLQLSLFDEQDLVEIAHPDYPGERLIACRNPLLAAERTRKRGELLDATQTLMDQLVGRVERGSLTGADAIGLAVGKVINKYKVGKHFDVHITDTSLTVEPKQHQIDAEAALDGVYVLRTSMPVDQLDPAGVVFAYKNLARLERDWRSIKADDLDLRPIHHRLEDRVKAHVLICMLACYLTWHLRHAWAPLTFTDDHPPDRGNPVTPAQRSDHAKAKASRGTDEHGHRYHGFSGLLDHLATLTRNQVTIPTSSTEIPMLADATADQTEAFALIGASIPVTIT
ncbi:MAG: IS1634 family transposase [Nocardioidaceae bacterium]